MRTLYFFQLIASHFWSCHIFPKKQKLKRIFSDNLGQNSWEPFHLLAQFVLITSETELEILQCQKVNVRVAERLQTYDLRKLGNLKNIPEMLGFDDE